MSVSSQRTVNTQGEVIYNYVESLSVNENNGNVTALLQDNGVTKSVQFASGGADVVSLSQTVASNTLNINNILTSQSNADTDVSNLDTSLTSLTSVVNANSGFISDNTDAITAIQESIGLSTTQIDTNTTDINNLQTTVSSLSGSTTTGNSILQTAVSQNSSDIATLQSNNPVKGITYDNSTNVLNVTKVNGSITSVGLKDSYTKTEVETVIDTKITNASVDGGNSVDTTAIENDINVLKASVNQVVPGNDRLNFENQDGDVLHTLSFGSNINHITSGDGNTTTISSSFNTNSIEADINSLEFGVYSVISSGNEIQFQPKNQQFTNSLLNLTGGTGIVVDTFDAPNVFIDLNTTTQNELASLRTGVDDASVNIHQLNGGIYSSELQNGNEVVFNQKTGGATWMTLQFGDNLTVTRIDPDDDGVFGEVVRIDADTQSATSSTSTTGLFARCRVQDEHDDNGDSFLTNTGLNNVVDYGFGKGLTTPTNSLTKTLQITFVENAPSNTYAVILSNQSNVTVPTVKSKSNGSFEVMISKQNGSQYTRVDSIDFIAEVYYYNIENATVSGDVLTFTRDDGTSVVYEPTRVILTMRGSNESETNLDGIIEIADAEDPGKRILCSDGIELSKLSSGSLSQSYKIGLSDGMIHSWEIQGNGSNGELVHFMDKSGNDILSIHTLEAQEGSRIIGTQASLFNNTTYTASAGITLNGDNFELSEPVFKSVTISGDNLEFTRTAFSSGDESTAILIGAFNKYTREETYSKAEVDAFIAPKNTISDYCILANELPGVTNGRDSSVYRELYPKFRSNEITFIIAFTTIELMNGGSAYNADFNTPFMLLSNDNITTATSNQILLLRRTSSRKNNLQIFSHANNFSTSNQVNSATDIQFNEVTVAGERYYLTCSIGDGGKHETNIMSVSGNTATIVQNYEFNQTMILNYRQRIPYHLTINSDISDNLGMGVEYERVDAFYSYKSQTEIQSLCVQIDQTL